MQFCIWINSRISKVSQNIHKPEKTIKRLQIYNTLKMNYTMVKSGKTMVYHDTRSEEWETWYPCSLKDPLHDSRAHGSYSGHISRIFYTMGSTRCIFEVFHWFIRCPLTQLAKGISTPWIHKRLWNLLRTLHLTMLPRTLTTRKRTLLIAWIRVRWLNGMQSRAQFTIFSRNRLASHKL